MRTPLVFAAVLTFAAGSALAAPSAPGPADAYRAPRTAFGQPDIGGYWTNVSMTPEQRPLALGGQAVYSEAQARAMETAALKLAADANRPTDPNAPPPTVGGDKPPAGTRPEFIAAGGAVGGYNQFWLDPGNSLMRVSGQPRTSILTTPNGRAPAALPGQASEYAGYAAYADFDDPEARSLGERCLMSFGRNAGPPMRANGFYNNDYRIVQTPGAVAIEVEMVHDVRVVRLNAAHRTDGVRPWMGDSVGRWDGDTLVVETTNLPKAQAYHGAWRDLVVTERFTRVGEGRLLYRFTVSDPSRWPTPFGGEYEFSPMKGLIYEYACHEGNYALRNMLAGARREDSVGKGAKAALSGAAGGGD